MMFPPNLFYDTCAEPSELKIVLQQLKITTPLSNKPDIFNNLSIINHDCQNAYQNKLQHMFFKRITKYYEEGSVTVFDILKHQHYQTLIITKDDNFVGGALYVLSLTEGSFVFFLEIDETFRS